MVFASFRAVQRFLLCSSEWQRLQRGGKGHRKRLSAQRDAAVHPNASPGSALRTRLLIWLRRYPEVVFNRRHRRASSKLKHADPAVPGKERRLRSDGGPVAGATASRRSEGSSVSPLSPQPLALTSPDLKNANASIKAHPRAIAHPPGAEASCQGKKVSVNDVAEGNKDAGERKP